MKLMLTVLLTVIVAAGSLPAQARSAADLYQEGVHLEDVKGDLPKAIAAYETVIERFPRDEAIAAKALVRLGSSYAKSGRSDDARAVYERVTREYPNAERGSGGSHRPTRIVG